jgi:hypothetical protein
MAIPFRRGLVGAMVEWVAPPHFYSGGKLLVLYVGDKQRTLEALDLLLGPQFAGGLPPARRGSLDGWQRPFEGAVHHVSSMI